MSTILVVDDMSLCRESTGEILRNVGFRVLTAASGEEALAILARQHVDAVLLDVVMPGMDGLTVLRRLREDRRWSSLPVVLLTDAAERSRVETAAGLRVQGYLLKSKFTVDDLLERVRELFSRCAVPTAAAAPAVTAASVTPAVSDAPAPRAGAPLKPRNKSEVLGLIRRKLELRAMPPVFHYVISLATSQRTCIDDIAEAARQDPALSLKIMKIANSSFYMGGIPVRSLVEATQRIGVSGLRNAAATVLTIDHFTDAATSGLIPQRFWEHATAVALLSQALGEAAGIEAAHELFLAGLLHDLGRMLLSGVLPNDYRRVLTEAREHGAALGKAEREAFGVSSAEITAEALKHLQMPERLVAAASQHGQGADASRRGGGFSRDALAVALANGVAHALALGDSGDPSVRPVQELEARLGLNAATVGRVAREATRHSDELQAIVACHADTAFREPLTKELTRKAGGRIPVAVLGGDDSDGLLGLFFARLGWLDNHAPEAAVLSAANPRQIAAGLEQLSALESASGRSIGLLVVALDSSAVPAPESLGGRTCHVMQLPCTHEAMLRELLELGAASGCAAPVATL